MRSFWGILHSIKCTSMKCEFYLWKNNKFGTMIKSVINDSKCAPSLVIHFPIIREICEYHVFLLRNIHRAIFSHLRTNQSAAQQVRDPSMQTSGNRKEHSLMNKLHRLDLPSWVLGTGSCRELVLPNVIKHWHEEKWLCVDSFWPFFKHGTVQTG